MVEGAKEFGKHAQPRMKQLIKQRLSIFRPTAWRPRDRVNTTRWFHPVRDALLAQQLLGKLPSGLFT
jgi:hypothetical protein